MRSPSSKSRLLATVAILASLALAGCATGPAMTTGSVGAPAMPRTEAEWRRDIAVYGERYQKDQKDAEAAVRYAQALRALGMRAQAVAVLEQASLHHTRNTAVLGAYGRALADAGNFSQALEVLNRAHTPDQPDWRILSAQGAVLDQMGRHEEARLHYINALRIVPDEPSVMSNLGLSYALSKNLKEAEQTLRRASALNSSDARVRQNLALVVGLQGRFQEAEEIARADLSPEDAQANLAYLRRMLADENGKKAKPPSRPLRQAANNS